MARIFQTRERVGIRTVGRGVLRGRWRLLSVLRRPFGVVFAPQRIAVALLLCTRALDGRDGLSLHGAMQVFVRAIRLRLSRMNALLLNAESHPPHMQVRQPVNGLSGAQDAMVRANRKRQSVFTKRALKDWTRRHRLRRKHAVTREQVPRVQIGDRERITIRPSTGAKLAVEIGGPQIIGDVRDGGHDAWMHWHATCAALVHESASRAQIGRGTRRRPIGDGRVSTRQDGQQFSRAPVRMRAT